MSQEIELVDIMGEPFLKYGPQLTSVKQITYIELRHGAIAIYVSEECEEINFNSELEAGLAFYKLMGGKKSSIAEDLKQNKEKNRLNSLSDSEPI